MNLHIGNGVLVALEHLVCVIDARNMAPDTRNFILRVGRENRVRPCEGRVKSYLVIRDESGKEAVLSSPIASTTLKKRWEDACLHTRIRELALMTVEPCD